MYCTSDQVKARNHSLLDSADPGEITTAISEAQGVVDGMCRKGYPVPFSTVPDEIVKITADLAAAALLSDVVGNTGSNDEPTQADWLYKKAMDLLKMINEGDFVLDVETPANVEETSVLRQARCNTYRGDHHGKFDHWDPSDPRTYHDHRRRR